MKAMYMKKTFPMRVLSLALCVAMLATVTPIFAAAESASYLDYNVTTGKTDVERTATGVNVIDEATDELVAGWNVVQGDVEIEERIALPGNVNLILANGATLTAKKGITVAETGNFLVYAQSNDADTMGKLVVPGADSGYAGIGSAESSGCGDIAIFGGDITAQGGQYGAGIGSGNMGDCGTITIYGGIVTATNGDNGAGIGGGLMSDCGDIAIYGGTVTAVSNQNAAAIGSGYYSNSCGVIAIGGGIVSAESKNFGAGIGSGSESPCNGVMITGGYVKATAARNAEPIGKGEDSYGEDDTPAVSVSIADSCTSVIVDKTRYINYKISAREPSCTESGFAAHYIDPYTENYYTALTFTEETLIGDEAALAAWKAEGGDGYTGAALGHDWQNAAGGIHRCARCDLVEAHTDVDENEICDACEAALSPYTLYLDYNETTGAVDVERKVWNANVIDEATDVFVTGWNIVKGDVEFTERIALPKDVNLILANGATLTAYDGITVATDGDFAVYAQSNDETAMGKLVVPGADVFSAGIGAFDNDSCGNIAIYGGAVTATGGDIGAGIGGSTESPCGDIAIYGGIVTAQGGEYGAGIGGGQSVRCGTVLITGGVVTAQGGFDGAGIGGGLDGSCSQVTITGGIVTAQGGDYGAGIGTGFEGTCNNLTITGGYVKATAGANATAIGAGQGGTVIKTSVDDACTSLFKDDAQYINYEPFAKVEPTCTSVGTAAYFKDYVSGNYYTAFPFTEDGLIGDDTALAAWKVEGGAGFLEKLSHEDADEDGACDVCGVSHATYLDYNETTGKVDIERELWGVRVITKATDSFATGWNFVKSNITFDKRIYLPAGVKLILANGVTLTAGKGITVPDGDFAVYAQSNDKDTMGKLIVPNNVNSWLSGIGGESMNKVCGNIAIYGGAVTAFGGSYGAAIGGGDQSGCGDITIRGGIVTVQGGTSGAGIGGGNYNYCGNITISGGVVNAQGGSGASGIGGGYSGTCDNITVSGGVVTSQGGTGGAGIGSGNSGSCENITVSGGVVTSQGGTNGAGIGSGKSGSCDNITVSGDMVTVQGGEKAAGIGSGNGGSFDSVLISGGYVKATAGLNAEPIGAGYDSEAAVVSIESSCTSVKDENTQYINYQIPALIPTCTEPGFTAYYIDPVSGLYYSSVSLAEDKLIGDATALASWKTQDGYVAPIGHDWEFVDDSIHKCKRCEATAAHVDEDGNYYCDGCDHVLLELAKAVAEAKGAAKAALDAAANPVGSDAQAQVLSDAKAAVDAAKTLDAVATAEANGLSAIAAQKATELAAKIAELKADITDNLLPAAKCYEAKDALYTALDKLDAAASIDDATSLYDTAKDEASGKDVAFAQKCANYKATFSIAITDVVSEETEQFVEDVQTALDNALSIAALDEIYEENEPLIGFHATKDMMLAQCNEVLESFAVTEAMKALYEMTAEKLAATTNMDELEEAYIYCAEQIELQRERESYLPKCETILASDEYSDEVKSLVREFMDALNAAESLDEIEYAWREYIPMINLQATRDHWMAELADLLPEEPSDAVKAIIEDAGELISFGADSSVFSNVFDVARRALERQLTAEANQTALEALLKKAADDLATANDTIASKDATIAEKQAALDTATEQLNEAQAAFETAKAQIDALEGTVSEQDEALKKAKEDIQSLQAEIERLKALLDDDPTEPTATDPTATGADESLLGDANEDGAVNMKDVLTLRKMLASMEIAYNAQNSDVNADGEVNMKDVLMLRKYLADMIDHLGA